MRKTKITRFTSILCAFVMLLTAFPASASAVDYENILLCGDNFVTPSGSNTEYIANGGTAANSLFDKSLKFKSTQSSTAKIYIENAGSYNVWVLSANENNAADRYARVGIDSETPINLTSHKDHMWEKTEWTLTKGWHEIKLSLYADWKNTLVNAVYVTNDTTYTPTTEADDTLKTYSDTTAPEIGAGDITPVFSGSECSVKFPASTDTGKVFYEYKIGSQTKEIADITKSAVLGSITEDTTVTFFAKDKHGNTSKKEFAIKAPEGGKPAVKTNDILLSADNFEIPDMGAGNGYVDNGGTATGNLFPKSVKIAGADSSVYIKARIYIDKDAKYNLWTLSANEITDQTSANFANRLAKAGFDGQYADCTSHTVHKWDKSEWTLTKGWHEVNVGMKNSWGNVKVNAVYITSNLEYNLETADVDDVLANHDTKAPTLESDSVKAEYSDNGKCTVTFPACTDAEGAAQTIYYVNGVAAESTDGKITLTNLKPLEKVTLKAEVFDKVGNKTVVTDTYISSPVKADGFDVKKGSDILTTLEGVLKDDTLKINAVLSNRTAEEIALEMSLCLYDKNYERMLCSRTSTVTLAANEATKAIEASLIMLEDFSANDLVLQATLWNKTTGEPYITGIEIKGAAQ